MNGVKVLWIGVNLSRLKSSKKRTKYKNFVRFLDDSTILKEFLF